MDYSMPGPLSLTISWSLPMFMSITLMMLFNHLTLCQSPIRVFSNESALPIWWPKYWSFSFSISPSNEHPGLISFRMDWLDLLEVHGTLKSLLQHHSSKASILQIKIIKKKPSALRNKMDTWFSILELCYNYLSYTFGIYFYNAIL